MLSVTSERRSLRAKHRSLSLLRDCQLLVSFAAGGGNHLQNLVQPNHGTRTLASGYPIWRPSDRGHGLYYNNVGGYVEFAHTPGLNITGDITLAAYAWVNENQCTFISKQASGSTYCYELYTGDAGNRFLRFYSNSTGNVASAITVPLSTWAMMVVRRVGSTFKFWVDYQTDTATNGNSFTASASATLRLGNDGSSAYDHHGGLGFAGVWSRGLLDHEVEALIRHRGLPPAPARFIPDVLDGYQWSRDWHRGVRRA